MADVGGKLCGKVSMTIPDVIKYGCEEKWAWWTYYSNECE